MSRYLAPPDASTVENYIKDDNARDLLRFITCGSVDDGKSTLIGRFLYESQLVYDDQLAKLEQESRRIGTQGTNLDFALLLDGLQAEREQGITIDVAYRFFSTKKRKFIVADTPGHEQYTRNMVTGASTASVAVVLVDARKGILTQTLRHSRIVDLLGIRHVVLAVNKMDLIGYDQSVFERLEEEYQRLAKDHSFSEIVCIPISALAGDNIVRKSGHCPWYQGKTLLEYLETVNVVQAREEQPFRMPVQWVNRPNLDFRGFCGRITAGKVGVGDEILVLPRGTGSTIASIESFDGPCGTAKSGDSITLTLADEIDVSRGDVIAAASHVPDVADQFEMSIVWMDEEALLPGRRYLCKLGRATVTATITRIKYVVDINSGVHLAGASVKLNDIAVVNVSFDRPVVFEAYTESPELGGCIFIDRITYHTTGAGMVKYALRRSSNIQWQHLLVNKAARAKIKSQSPKCCWLTGLSGAGKSTIANIVEKRLQSLGKHSYLLDGDNVRHGLNRDLGFTDADRVENVRRVGEVAKLMVDAGLIVIVSFISPFRSERNQARSLFEEGEFIEVFIDTPIEVCEGRDPKGLYAKARQGTVRNFTGIDSEYQVPTAPEIHLKTVEDSAEMCAEKILRYIDAE